MTWNKPVLIGCSPSSMKPSMLNCYDSTVAQSRGSRLWLWRWPGMIFCYLKPLYIFWWGEGGIQVSVACCSLLEILPTGILMENHLRLCSASIYLFITDCWVIVSVYPYSQLCHPEMVTYEGTVIAPRLCPLSVKWRCVVDLYIFQVTNTLTLNTTVMCL